MWNIERAGADDFREIVDFLDRIFRFEPGHFESRYSHIYRPTKASMSCLRLIRDAGRLIGVFGVFPLRLLVHGAELQVSGIGGVSTDPDYRGRGVMSAFLNQVSRERFEKGDDLSILWGMRERYGRYGWEIAGQRLLLTMTDKSPWTQSGAGLRRLDPKRDLARAHVAYSKLPLRARRSREVMRLQFERAGHEAYVSDRATRFAYAILMRKPRRLLVEAAGDVDGIENILSALVRREKEPLAVVAPAALTPVNERYRRLAAIVTSEHLGSIKIVNLASTLEKLAPVLARGFQPLARARLIRLEMTDSGQSATLELGRRFKVSTGAKGRAVVVRRPDREMVRLVFGHAGAGPDVPLPERAEALGHVFPAPLYLYDPDRV